MTPGESLIPWVLLIGEESYLPSEPYLGQTTSEKEVGAQNEKCPNRDMQNYWKSGKRPVTLHKTKVKQMEPLWVMLTFPTHRHLSNSQKKLLSQKMFSSC